MNNHIPIFNIGIIICSVLMIAFVTGLSWVLRELSQAMEFSSFMLFGVVTIALIISAGYAWDHYERRVRGDSTKQRNRTEPL